MSDGSATPRVRAIGGVFFRAKDPKALGAWYRDKLGFPVEACARIMLGAAMEYLKADTGLTRETAGCRWVRP